MTWVDVLTGITKAAFKEGDTPRNGYVIPDTESVGAGSVKLNAAFLYADLAGSSLLTKHCPWQTTSSIIRAYLECATRLIREYNGQIKSFDGDRVMGVFIGDNKETLATRCAREIDYTVEKIIEPMAKATFGSIQRSGISIKHCIGIDVGEAIAVRAGIRGSNDLIWIGKAPSFAAKLSDIRAYPYAVYISSRVFLAMDMSEKITGATKLYEYLDFEFAGVTEIVYRTKYWITP